MPKQKKEVSAANNASSEQKTTEKVTEIDVSQKAKLVIKIAAVGLLCLALLAGGGIYFYQHYNRTMTVYDAKITGDDVIIKAKAEGTIAELLVNDGDQVAAGDVIAKITPKVTDEEIKQLTQNVELSKQNLEQLKKGATVTTPAATTAPTVDYAAQQRAAQAAARLQRMNELYSMGAISAVKRDEAAADYAAAQAAASVSTPAASPAPAATTTAPVSQEIIKQAELQVKQAEASLKNAQQELQATEIVATTAGTVTLADDVSEGATVKANQAIVKIAAADSLWLEAKLTVDQAMKVRLGQFVNYTIDNKNYQGTVQDIVEPEADDADASSGDDRTLVRISVPPTDDNSLAPGLSAVVKFAVNN